MRRLGSVLVAVSMAMLGMTLIHPADAAPRRTAAIAPSLASRLAVATSSESLVVFVHGRDVASARNAVRDAGLRLVTTWDAIGVAVGSGLPAAVRDVLADERVSYVEADQPLEMLLNTAHTATRAAEARTVPELFDAQGHPFDGTGATIAVNDSGADGSHPMFTDNGVSKVKVNIRELCSELVCSGVGADMAQTPFNDSDTLGAGGHGTHVSGIAAGYERTTSNGRIVRGVAPGATLAVYGSGAFRNVLAANAGLDWVLDHHTNPCAGCPPIRVVNNSWSGSAGGFDPNSSTSLLVNQLVAAGVVVVFAAGNSGGDGSANKVSSEAQNPVPGVIGVANYNDADSGTRTGTLSSSSSRGKRGVPAGYPDISAPGTRILSSCDVYQPICGSIADPKYSAISGTSMAAPYIAGVVALMAQANPSLTPAEIEDILEDTAYKFGDPSTYEPDVAARNADDTTSFDKGHGLVDVVEVLRRVLGLPSA